MNWVGFGEAFVGGVGSATFGYVGVLGLAGCGYWVVRTTPKVSHRWLILALPAMWLMTLMAIASIQLAPAFFLDVLFMPLFIMPLIQIGSHGWAIGKTDGGNAQACWAALNVLFACRAVLYVGAFI